MDSMSAFARGEASKNNPVMVFDWDKAAQIIKECGAVNASAGLEDDWEWTGGEILREGIPITNRSDTYTYLSSTWAEPQLQMDDGEKIACFRMMDDSPEWNSDTLWPESSLAILGIEVEVKR